MKVTLEAARINSGMTQEKAASCLEYRGVAYRNMNRMKCHQELI